MVLIKDIDGSHGHKGQWVLLSKSQPKRVLQIFGPLKPDSSEVSAAERRIHHFKKTLTVKAHSRRRPKK